MVYKYFLYRSIVARLRVQFLYFTINWRGNRIGLVERAKADVSAGKKQKRRDRLSK